ncbi:MAG: cobalt ECF transporter T component CbiQ [Candidatus Aminicenantes bacterium]
MMSFFTTGDQNPKKRFVHQLDPRVKLISFFTLGLAAVFTPSRCFLKFMGYFLMLLILVVVDRIPVKEVGKRMALILPLLFFLASSVLLFGGEKFSQDLMIIWNLFIKSFLIFLSLAVLSLTTEFHHLVKALELLRIPRLIPALLFFAHRYSFLFSQEGQRMLRARESRRFGRKKKMAEIKLFSRLLSPLFFRTFSRSERVYAAMLSRGYEGKIQTMSFLSLGTRDILFIFFFFSILVFIWVWP